MPRSVKQIMEQADELAARFADHDPDPADRPAAESLAAVHRAALAEAKAAEALVEAVNRARKDGQSWAAIGRRLGTSGEAARQRYGKPSRV